MVQTILRISRNFNFAAELKMHFSRHFNFAFFKVVCRIYSNNENKEYQVENKS